MGTDAPRAQRLRPGPIIAGVLLIALAIGLAYRGIAARGRALATVAMETREMSVPTVAVTSPERGLPQQEIVLPGTMQAYTDSPIYARVSGYLKVRHVDIGEHVRAGQLLAEIDTPEVDQQIRQANADLGTATANMRLAETTAARYRDLIKTDSVAQQDLDNANGALEARQAAVESARANMKRLEELQAFRRILAPFDGVISVRNTDVGALIDSGGNAKELFHIVSIGKLRLFVNVPEIFVPAARAGLTADITVTEYPERHFTGTLVRTANAIDVASRTLLTEIDVENRGGELLPGAYAQVHLKLPTPRATVRLPVDALLFRSEGLRVAIVGADGKVQLKPITIGRDFGTEVEVVAGLDGAERVVVNPPDSLEAGQVVRVIEATRPERGGSAAGATK